MCSLLSQAANGNVRANAAALLVEAFPLQNPEAGVSEIDEVMQKQFLFLSVGIMTNKKRDIPQY